MSPQEFQSKYPMATKMRIGIDPGASGGISVLYGVNPVAEKMPDTNKDILDILQTYAVQARMQDLNIFACIEAVHSMPGQGVASSFKFGKGFGALLMALEACEIPYELITPQKWQKAMGCLTKGDKNVSKAKAQQLFPSLKITHATADSLLIAEYCRRTFP